MVESLNCSGSTNFTERVKESMKFPKLALPQKVKSNLPAIMFVLIIPLGILVGYFFSNIRTWFFGSYKNVLTPINKLFYVAKVDGVGVSRGEWEKNLKARYGRAAARDLIDMVMIDNELKKAGIQVTQEEINSEIAEIERQLGGQSMEEVLSQQGLTLSDFRKQVALQVGMKKLLSDKVVVADTEVSDFVKSYGDSLTGATDEEKFNEAKKILTDQKLGEEINKWYGELQGKVVVENYLDPKAK